MDYLTPESYWLTDAAKAHAGAKAFRPLTGDAETDVVIIGAGITGLTAAMMLQQAGRQVMILEAGRVGAGTSSATTGHLDVMPDQQMSKLIQQAGREQAGTLTRARAEAIDTIEQWATQLDMDCDFVRVPAYLYTEHKKHVGSLQEQVDAFTDFGVGAAAVTDAQLPYANAGGLRLERQARIDGAAYVAGLAKYLDEAGVRIHEQTRADPPEDGSLCTVKTGQGDVRAQAVLVCTHSPFFGISELDMRVAPYQSYAAAVEVGADMEDALWWDDEDPYHYIRRARSDRPRLLIVGGADHKTGQGGDEREPMEQLIAWTRTHLPVVSVHARWSAEFFEPADGIPLVGKLPLSDHLYVATGYSGSGLTYGTAAGKVLAQLVCGHKPAVGDVLSPARLKPLAAGANLLSENMNVARRYVQDRFAGEKMDDLSTIAAGEGMLVKRHGKQRAVYRDDDGRLHVLSPVCTHAGCHVQWNELESTWDCPCHGGRYGATGERIYGPAPHNLEPEPFEKE